MAELNVSRCSGRVVPVGSAYGIILANSFIHEALFSSSAQYPDGAGGGVSSMLVIAWIWNNKAAWSVARDSA